MEVNVFILLQNHDYRSLYLTELDIEEGKRNKLDITVKAVMIYPIIMVKQIRDNNVFAILELCVLCVSSPFWQIDNMQKWWRECVNITFKKRV